MRKHIISIYGPTGVGKSDYALALAQDFPLEIINCDVGQLYTPLSIGTAKPDWKREKTPHHLFDLLNEPRDYTVVDYRKAVLELCQQVWERNATPVLVGGSGFYIKSLFFPPLSPEQPEQKESLPLYEGQTTDALFATLQKLDPIRASQVHPHDRYRIERALTLANRAPGTVHTLQPTYHDLGFPYALFCLSRERSELYKRINERTEKMMDAGWIEEVQGLQKTAWAPFLNRKKLIGYNDILSFLKDAHDRKKLVEIIAQKTRHYAKRQMTFWRMLEKELAVHCTSPSIIEQIMITNERTTYLALKSRISTFLNSL